MASDSIEDDFAILDKPKKLFTLDKFVFKIEKSIEYLCNINDAQRVLVDERAYRATTFLKINTTHADVKSRLEINDTLIKLFVEILNFYIKDFKSYVENRELIRDIADSEGIEKVYRAEFRYALIMMPIHWNITNRSKEYSLRFHRHGGTKALMAYLDDDEIVKNCLNLKFEKPQLLDKTPPGITLLRAFIGTVNNLSKLTDDIHNDLSEMKATLVLMKFASNIKHLSTHRMSAYMAIANIISDDEIETLPDTEFVITDIVHLIKIGSELIASDDVSKIKREVVDIGEKIAEVCVVNYLHCEYHIIELLQVLYRLSVNDKIKLNLYENFSIKQYLKNIFLFGNDVEREFTAKLLWQLCFKKEIAVDVQNDIQLYEAIVNASKAIGNETNLNRFCNGIVWSMTAFDVQKIETETPLDVSSESIVTAQIESMHSVHSVKSEKKKKSKSRSLSTTTPTKPNHIMISYNRESRNLCLKIKNELEIAGYKTWIDVEQISGSSLDSMANAIEECMCVVMCMTEKYKQSPNCRAEAEYAFKLNVPIIPLIMQPDYSPDGWLGIILGTKIFVNFTRYSFEECMKRLTHEIVSVSGKNDNSDYTKENVQPIGGAVNPHVDHNSGGGNASSKIKAWSENDVKAWLNKTGIHDDFKKLFKNYNGKMLAQAFQIKAQAPEYFYKSISQNYKIQFHEIVKFLSEFDELFI